MSDIKNPVYGNWMELPWETIRPGVSRSVFAMDLDEITCSVGELKNGHELNPHAHEYIQLAICISGCFDYYVDDKCYKMTKGSWIIVPPNATHYAKAYESTETTIGCDIFIPSRQQFKDTYIDFLRKQGVELK